MWMKLNSLLAQRIRSSASRDRCTASRAASAQNSIAKSRSLTASIEFCDTRGRPLASDKTQQPGDPFAVQRQSRAGKGAAAQGADIHPRQALLEALSVAFEHLHIGQQMVRQIDRLGPLQMRVAGDDHQRFALAQPTKARCMQRISSSKARVSSRSQSRRSSATWSLRERPVWSLRPGRRALVNSASIFM